MADTQNQNDKPKPRPPSERVPPHSQEAEVAVLGAILLEPKAMGSVAAGLQPDYFYRPAHQILYRAFANLFNRNEPIDVVSIREELRRMGESDVAGNADLFITLSGAVPSAANAEYYAKIVQQKHLLRELITACNESLVDAYDEVLSSGEILDAAENRVFQVATNFESSRPEELREVIMTVLRELQDNPDGLLGLHTLFADLDHLTHGLHAGEFVVIGGRPSTGKTTLSLNLIERIGIRQGQGVLMFSLEMPKEQIARNLLCCHVAMDADALRTGKLDRSQWDLVRQGASDLNDSPILIDDASTLTPAQLRSKCRRVFARHEIKMILIDYLQLMSADTGRRNESRQQEITEISRSLKALAKEMRVPVVALSQLSRAATSERSERPRLSHLRESGAIEQDADLVLLLHRNEDAPPEEANVTEVIIAKQRNGPTDTVKLTFRKERLRFEDFSPYDATQMGTPPPVLDQDDYDDDGGLLA
jgi:replicative DNA helicase